MKAIAVDIDGTITDENRRICISAIEAILRAEERKYPVILVTGNILCFAKTVSVLLGTSGGLVAENGGVLQFRGKTLVLGDIEKCKDAYSYLKSKIHVEKVEFSEQRVSEIAIKRKVDVDRVKEILADFDVKIYDTKFAIHITDSSVDKGSALKIVAKDIGINLDDILAIGDSENDIEFLQIAGFGAAVSNADPKLKRIADYVSKKPYGDGFAEILERFVL